MTQRKEKCRWRCCSNIPGPHLSCSACNHFTWAGKLHWKQAGRRRKWFQNPGYSDLNTNLTHMLSLLGCDLCKHTHTCDIHSENEPVSSEETTPLAPVWQLQRRLAGRHLFLSFACCSFSGKLLHILEIQSSYIYFRRWGYTDGLRSRLSMCLLNHLSHVTLREHLLQVYARERRAATKSQVSPSILTCLHTYFLNVPISARAKVKILSSYGKAG